MAVQNIDDNNNNQLVPSLIPPPFIKAKANSGASNHYWRPQDIDALSNIESTTTGPKVKRPNNEIIQTNQTGIINLPTNKLSKQGQRLLTSPNVKMLCLFHLASFKIITASQF